jgi:hypothetical protein
VKQEINNNKQRQQENTMRKIITTTLCVSAAACIWTFSTGCKSSQPPPTPKPATPAATTTPKPATTTPTPAAPTMTTPAPAPAATAATGFKPKAGPDGIYRIKCGTTEAFTDSTGKVWQSGEEGFEGGQTVERDASTAIANTKDAGLYLNEHYSMESFSCVVPNGKYTANLHFAETFEGVSGPGQRVFTYNVPQGKHEVKDFDIFVTGSSPLHSPATSRTRKSTGLSLFR